jgi:CBS-domain-containing membrane protein
MVTMIEVVWSWVGAFIGIGLVGLVGSLVLDQLGQGMLIGSFGATAVLVYGAIRSPLAQPRNFLGGHVVSALTGVLAYHLVGGTVWLATAIAVMYLTKTRPPPPPPPGGATALIAVIGSDSVHSLGYMHALVPVGLGAVILIVVALLVNNAVSTRRYPDFWR